jgi:hypothetical protein
MSRVEFVVWAGEEQLSLACPPAPIGREERKPPQLHMKLTEDCQGLALAIPTGVVLNADQVDEMIRVLVDLRVAME